MILTRLPSYLVLTLGITSSGFGQGTGLESFPLRDQELTDRGRELASIYCRSCHDYRRTHIGPKLGGITRYRSREWLMDFVKDPAGLAASGDETAIDLIARYKVPMPGFATLLSDDDLEAIFSSIAAYSDRRKLTFDPSEDNPRVQEMLAVPTEPVPPATHALVLEDVVTMPVIPNPRDIARIATLRTVPGDDSEDLYISNQDGSIYRIREGESKVVLNIRNHFPDFFNYPGLGSGLGSFDFHPNFNENGLVYVTHTETCKKQSSAYLPDSPLDEAVQAVISEVRVKAPGEVDFAGASWREILRITLPTTVHGMQDIAFAPFAQPGDADYGLLFIGIGDGGSTAYGYPHLTHRLDAPLGSILRIDPRGTNGRNGQYGIPADNPFVDNKTPDIWPEIYAWGFRNPHRLTWDPFVKNRFLAIDVGSNLFEEINVIEAGRDYGWNVREGNLEFDPVAQNPTEIIPWNVDEPDYVEPLAVYSHLEGRAICGGPIYRGSIEWLRGKFIFGDIVTGNLYYLDPDHPGKPQPIFRLSVTDANGRDGVLGTWIKGRVDLRLWEDAAGELYLLTKTDGGVRRVVDVKIIGN
jgi:glucose/arabinose dehydrogenase/mono/diheme cytochrome c family protein